MGTTYLKPIILNEPQKKQSKIAAVLDYVSAPLSQPITTFTKGFKAGARKVRKTREEIKTGSTSGWKVIGTTAATTAVLGAATLAAGGAAGAGAAGGAARGAFAKLGTAAIKSPVIRTAAVITAFDPQLASSVFRSGGGSTIAAAVLGGPVAGLVVGLRKGTGFLGQTAKEFVSSPNVQDALKIAGGAALAGGAVAGGVAAVSALTKSAKAKSQPYLSKIPSTMPTLPKMSSPIVPISEDTTISPVGSLSSPTSQPVIAEPETPKETKGSFMGVPNIKITNKPQINIAIAK